MSISDNVCHWLLDLEVYTLATVVVFARVSRLTYKNLSLETYLFPKFSGVALPSLYLEK